MKQKIILGALLAFLACKGEAQTVQIYCPTKIEFTPQAKSWASYGYTGYTRVNLAAVGDQIKLMGEGNSTPASTPVLEGADWTDRTFLCNYTGKTAQGAEEAMVLYETVLSDYVETCHFAGNASSCYSNNPIDCPISCVLNEK